MSHIKEVPLYAVQGDDEAYTFAFSLDGTTPLDITGYTFELTVGESQLTAEASDLMPGASVTITDGPNGEASLSLSNTDTDQPLGTYFYRVKWIDTSAKVKTIMKGTLSIEWAK